MIEVAFLQMVDGPRLEVGRTVYGSRIGYSGEKRADDRLWKVEKIAIDVQERRGATVPVFAEALLSAGDGEQFVLGIPVRSIGFYLWRES